MGLAGDMQPEQMFRRSDWKHELVRVSLAVVIDWTSLTLVL